MTKSDRKRVSGNTESDGSKVLKRKRPDETKRPHSSSPNVPKSQPDADILHASFTVAELPTDMAAIYTRVVRHLLPQQQRHISEAAIMEEVDGATLTFGVPNKSTAEAMFRRLQNAKVFGRRWKLQYHPLRLTQGAKEACLVDVLLVPPAPRELVVRALGGVQGFLTLVDAEGDAQSEEGKRKERRPAHRVPTSSAEVGEEDVAQRGVKKEVEGGEERLVASFVDEGSALHARAVLSGRIIGTSGVRLFLERRR